MSRISKNVFKSIRSTLSQRNAMASLSFHFLATIRAVEANVPDSADRTHVIRGLRESFFWASEAVRRERNGKPRMPKEVRNATLEQAVETPVEAGEPIDQGTSEAPPASA